MKSRPVYWIFAGVLLVLLACVPLLSGVTGNSYVTTVMTRVLILAIAASSLNILLGYGGLVSLGHAAFVGVGAYATGILIHHGIGSGSVHVVVAVLASSLAALVIGALSLRTRGVYFIMVTLAFAQMVYFVSVGLDAYGGDDGLMIENRSVVPGVSLSDRPTFYFVCLAVLVAVVLFVTAMARARFGLVLRGGAMNEARMRALGFPLFRYRLLAFTITGAICGIAGLLLANHTEFVSPSMMSWTRSADLIIMVVLGGAGTAIGPVLGALAFMLAEEALSHVTTYWQLIFGPLILLSVRFAGRGLAGLIPGAADNV